MPPPPRKYRYFVTSAPESPGLYNVMEQSVMFPDVEHTRVAARYNSEGEANATAEQLNAGTYHTNWRAQSKTSKATKPNRGRWWFRE